MKRLFRILTVTILLLSVGCIDDDLFNRLDNLEERVSRLEELCREMNTNISSLQTIVTALQTNDYVTAVTPIVEDGKTVGYTISFVKSDPITIYHGKDGADGKDGENGADGKDGQDGKDGKDGYTPVIGVRQDSDGIYYWTLDGDWLLDANGNKIKAQGIDGKDGQDGEDGADGKDGEKGEPGAPGQNGQDGKDGENGADGKDGQDGKDGVDGQDGITPQLKIEGEYWYISYDNGASWTRLGKATGENGKDGTNGTNGADGKDGQDGDSFFRSVTQDEENVYFELADGTLITLPKGTALNITFDESDLVVMSAKSTRSIGYSVSSMTDKVTVEVTSSADIKAKVIPADNSRKTGTLQVSTGSAIDEYSKVIVFVSNGDKVIMRSITFEETGLAVVDNATKQAPAVGGEVVLEFLTNVKCEATIPEEAQDWISVVPATRAMKKQTITLKLEPNEGYNRVAIVTVQSPDGRLCVEYQVEQEGDLGLDIDPTKIPNNEIWYITDNKQIICFDQYVQMEEFGANLISNTYKNGKGVIKFDDDIKAIASWAFALCDNLISFHMPLNGKVDFIGNNAFYNTTKLQTIKIPETITQICYDAFLSSGIESIDFGNNIPTLSGGGRSIACLNNIRYIYGKYASRDNRCLIKDGVLMLFAGADITEYTIPEDVSIIGDGAFWNIQSLETVVIPSSVKSIGNGAFHDCSALKNVYMTEGLEIIDTHAFMYCPSLIDIVIPNSVIRVNDLAFEYSKIKSITIGSGLTQLKWADENGLDVYAFANTEIRNFKGNLTSEDTYVCGPYIVPCYRNFNKYLCGYAKGKGITEIVIPEGVDGIANYTFARDEDIKTLYLPSTIRSLGPVSFEWCENLEFIYGPGASDDNKCYVINDTLCLFAEANTKEYTTPHNVKYIYGNVFQNKTQIEKITFSDEVISVGDSQIWGCQNLKTITYSARTTRLCNDAFFTGCNVLEDVYLRAPIPPAISQIGHNSIDNNVSIYVPEESLQAYLNSNAWIPYREYIKGYKYTDLPKPDYYTSTDYSQDGVVTTLQTATKGNGIDIVLMGDAYSDRQIADGTYRTDMEYIYNNLFTEEPYKSFRDYFNVYYVTAVSATEGYEYGNTALAGYFGGGTLVGGNDNAVFNYAQKAITTDRMDEALLIVAMNSDNYAGTCYMYYPDNNAGYGNGVSVAYFPRGGDETTFAQLLHHEACGHGFAKLADEYAYEYMGAIPSDYATQTLTQQESWGWWKNIDFTNNLSQIRWSHFLNDSRYQYDGLGAYEGGYTYWTGVWRPTDNSIMRYNTGGFNAPSREAIYYRIHKLAYGNSWQYDYEEFVEWDARNRKTEAEMSRAPYRAPANFKHTAPPVVIKGSWRDAKPKEK